MKLTIWQTLLPAELKRQLAEFERRFELVSTEVTRLTRLVPTALIESLSWLTIPTRSVNLSEKHALDPWVLVTSDMLTTNAGTLEYAEGFLIQTVLGATQSRSTEASHPGGITVTSTTSADSGVVVSTGPFRVEGGEYAIVVFKTANSFTDRRVTLGVFQTTSSTSEPTDGCYLYASGSSSIAGKTANASSRSTTGTSLSLTTSTWYTGLVKVNNTRTLVTYAIYSDAGTLLWSDTLATNIPSSSTSLFGGIKLSCTTASSLACGNVDYAQVRIGGPGRTQARYIGSATELFT